MIRNDAKEEKNNWTQKAALQSTTFQVNFIWRNNLDGNMLKTTWEVN